MRPMTSSASMTTPRFVSAVGGRCGESRPVYGARGNCRRLTTNNADLLGRLLLVVREVHRAIRRAVWRIGHFICFVV